MADAVPGSGEILWPKASSGRMVMHLTVDFLVAGSNPGRANMAAALLTTINRPELVPAT